MPMVNLKTMHVAGLLNLRQQVDAALAQRRTELEKQLRELGALTDGARARVGASPLAGKKVAPKYRDPKTGATWSGRGAKAGWIVAAMKEGKKIDDFLIQKTGQGTRKKRRAKR